MKVWLKPDAPGEVSIRTGGYDKTFNRADEPFEVDEADWDRVLKPTGYFVASPPPKVATKKPPKASQAPPEGPSSDEEGQA
jgi:hypothetical protein